MSDVEEGAAAGDGPGDADADDAGIDADAGDTADADADAGAGDDGDAGADEAGADANTAPAATAATVLDFLVRQLVEEPDAVAVEAVERSRGVQLEVRVAPGDLGRVIGKRGRTAAAIRTVTRAAAVRDRVDVNIEFLE